MKLAVIIRVCVRSILQLLKSNIINTSDFRTFWHVTRHQTQYNICIWKRTIQSTTGVESYFLNIRVELRSTYFNT
jgi:hypothetical protein